MDSLYFNQFTAVEYPELELDGADGPYLSVQNNSIHFLQVNERGDIIRQIANRNGQPYQCLVDNRQHDHFAVTVDNINSFAVKSSEFEQAPRVIVISDIEGNFDALYSLLIANSVMNVQYQWIFGDGQLVLLGDMMDKGKNVTQCLWLVYHLETQARREGGSVHFILGNHDTMNLTLDVRYVHEKYLALAQKVSRIDNPALAYWHLMKHNNVLTDWIKGKNCIEKIGDLLFVHGGISREIMEEELTIKDLNDIARQFLNQEWPAHELTELVLGKNGPLWYRGLVEEKGSYEKVSEDFIDEILTFYNVKKIIVGHTLVEAVSSDYHGKVIRVDVKHPDAKSSKESQGLLIEADQFYRIDGRGDRIKI